MTRGLHFKDFKIFLMKMLVGSVTAPIPRVREQMFCVSFIEKHSDLIGQSTTWPGFRKEDCVFYKQ